MGEVFCLFIFMFFVGVEIFLSRMFYDFFFVRLIIVDFKEEIRIIILFLIKC